MNIPTAVMTALTVVVAVTSLKAPVHPLAVKIHAVMMTALTVVVSVKIPAVMAVPVMLKVHTAMRTAITLTVVVTSLKAPFDPITVAAIPLEGPIHPLAVKIHTALLTALRLGRPTAGRISSRGQAQSEPNHTC